MQTGHEVHPEQFEPGLPDEAQARWHQLHLTMIDLDLEAELGILPRLSLSALLPFRLIRQRIEFLDHPDPEEGRPLSGFESIHHRNETVRGLADVAIAARYRLVHAMDHGLGIAVDLSAGLTLPTGGIEPNPFELGRQGLPHQHFFFGNGTFDPVGGLSAEWALESFSLFGWGTARVPLYHNRYGYRGEREALVGVGAHTRFGLEDVTFMLQPQLYFETPALWETETDLNSGRTDVLASAAVFWNPFPGWQLHASVTVPVYTRSLGGQLEIPVVLAIGLGRTLQIFDEAG